MIATLQHADPTFSRLHGSTVRGAPIGDGGGAGAAAGRSARPDVHGDPNATSSPAASTSTATTAATTHHLRFPCDRGPGGSTGTRLSEPGREKRSLPRPRWRPSRRRIAITVGAILALVATSVIVRAGLLTHSTRATPVDGGFETPQIPSYTTATVAAGQSVGAWTVTQGNVDLLGSGFWSAAEGTQSVDLGGLVNGAIAQTFSTIPGQTYMVEFALAGNPDGPPSVKAGRASVNGQPVMDFTSDITGMSRSNMGYRKMRFSFTSSGTQTTIEFASTSGTAWGPVIDDVSVAPVSLR